MGTGMRVISVGARHTSRDDSGQRSYLNDGEDLLSGQSARCAQTQLVAVCERSIVRIRTSRRRKERRYLTMSHTVRCDEEGLHEKR